MSDLEPHITLGGRTLANNIIDKQLELGVMPAFADEATETTFRDNMALYCTLWLTKQTGGIRNSLSGERIPVDFYTAYSFPTSGKYYFSWGFANPDEGVFVWDNTLPETTQSVKISWKDLDNVEMNQGLVLLRYQEKFKFVSVEDESNFATFQVSGPSKNRGLYFELPVTLVESSGGELERGKQYTFSYLNEYQKTAEFFSQGLSLLGKTPGIFITESSGISAGVFRVNGATENLANTSIGYRSGEALWMTGQPYRRNVTVGAFAGQMLQGNDNTIVGHAAGNVMGGHTQSVIVGAEACSGLTLANRSVVLGYTAAQNEPFLRNIFTVDNRSRPMNGTKNYAILWGEMGDTPDFQSMRVNAKRLRVLSGGEEPGIWLQKGGVVDDTYGISYRWGTDGYAKFQNHTSTTGFRFYGTDGSVLLGIEQASNILLSTRPVLISAGITAPTVSGYIGLFGDTLGMLRWKTPSGDIFAGAQAKTAIWPINMATTSLSLGGIERYSVYTAQDTFLAKGVRIFIDVLGTASSYRVRLYSIGSGAVIAENTVAVPATASLSSLVIPFSSEVVQAQGTTYLVGIAANAGTNSTVKASQASHSSTSWNIAATVGSGVPAASVGAIVGSATSDRICMEII